MHQELQHEALQEEEVRAVVIEVEHDASEDEEELTMRTTSRGTQKRGHTHSEGGNPRLCQQMVTLEVDGDLMIVHTLSDCGSAVSLVRKKTAREATLLPIRVPRQVDRGFGEGKETAINSCFHLPLLDADRNVQAICAYGVETIVNLARSRPPRNSCKNGK
jgi:hypothetical protein